MSYPTKARIKEDIRALIKRNPNNSPLSVEDEKWMLQILKHHPEFAEKVGVGIQHLEVRQNVNWSGTTRGLWIIRKDGSEIDISWVVCFNAPRAIDNLAQAAREEIHPQIHAHHEHGPCDRCPLCLEPMERRNGVHVDHEEPFAALLDRFLQQQSLTVEQVAIRDLGTTAKFEDRALARAWQEFHQSTAKLRITHKRCNLARRAA